MNVLCEFSDNVGSDKVKVYFLLLSGKSFFAVKNKAEILQEDFSLFCYFACCKKTGLMVKCTPERGHNALFFIPLQVLIVQ